MRKILISILFFLTIISSCKTTTEPIKYDKKIDVITQEIQLIHELINNENYEEAGKLIEYDLKLYPDDMELLNMKAWYLLQKGEYDQSENLFQEILDKNKSNPLAYTGLARIYRITGKPDKAEENIKKSLSYTMLISGIWLEKGLLEFERKEYKQALVDFTKSVNLDLKNNDAQFFKYLTMLYSGRDYDDVKYIWDAIIKSGNIKSYYFLYNAQYFYENNQSESAFYIIKNGLDAFSDNPYLLNFYSYLMLEKYKSGKNAADLDESEKSIQKCLDKKIEAEFVDTYFSILEVKNENEKIKTLLDRYLLEFPESEILIKWLKK